MSLNGLKTRTKVIQQLRVVLTKNGFEEIEPQLFSLADTLEPAIYPFKTSQYYLPTSPESFLKQVMAAGMGDCFAVSHVFRNFEGRGSLHGPEFMMAEWYRQNSDYKDMMKVTEQIISEFIPLDYVATLSWIDLWKQIGLDLNSLIDDQSMVNCAQSRGYNPENATWEQLFNQIADNEIVPLFPSNAFFLIDYPSKISPLALPRKDNPSFAERFELFIEGIEIANGNTENVDVEGVKKVMQTEQIGRADGSLLNQDFLNALEVLKNQKWAGVGLGIDRLAMIVGGFRDIVEVQSLISSQKNAVILE